MVTSSLDVAIFLLQINYFDKTINKANRHKNRKLTHSNKNQTFTR